MLSPIISAISCANWLTLGSVSYEAEANRASA
jgi:hypothetical protein